MRIVSLLNGTSPIRGARRSSASLDSSRPWRRRRAAPPRSGRRGRRRRSPERSRVASQHSAPMRSASASWASARASIVRPSSLNSPDRRVAGARHGDASLAELQGRLDRHLVAGQGAGLVRADDRRRAERLDGGQAADEGAACGPCAACRGRASWWRPRAGPRAPPRWPARCRPRASTGGRCRAATPPRR
jgi:hypothetical protein